MIIFSEMAIPLILFLVSKVICKSIEIGNGTVLNIEEMNQTNLIHPDNSQNIFNLSTKEDVESNEIQGTYII